MYKCYYEINGVQVPIMFTNGYTCSEMVAKYYVKKYTNVIAVNQETGEVIQ